MYVFNNSNMHVSICTRTCVHNASGVLLSTYYVFLDLFFHYSLPSWISNRSARRSSSRARAIRVLCQVCKIIYYTGVHFCLKFSDKTGRGRKTKLWKVPCRTLQFIVDARSIRIRVSESVVRWSAYTIWRFNRPNDYYEIHGKGTFRMHALYDVKYSIVYFIPTGLIRHARLTIPIPQCACVYIHTHTYIYTQCVCGGRRKYYLKEK